MTMNLFFWNLKTPSDNAWHPEPGKSPVQHRDGLPLILRRIDTTAAIPDVAPFVAGAGSIAHLSQYNSLGWTTPASIFQNPRTLSALNRSATIISVVFLSCQAAGLDYRYLIPRWASDREKRRDELEVRRHVETGMIFGLGSSIVRTIMGWGPRFSLLDIVMGGALADLAHREYCKAHGL
ncbi:hypothetical protein K431DRAFT_306923 [Polychaeton citri CBS 116435]|uniref:Uncharacterized protein n=1 Tax=Polychaeton citri CBS 116435 TaxID=1314669 RepID=A0A9P4UL58_9PEZI|nr:hypothetical protein K431DRAFT_306923 [Polychaeton citri CBS 116435]